MLAQVKYDIFKKESLKEIITNEHWKKNVNNMLISEIKNEDVFQII
jgi:hypothetical protein